VGELEDVLMDVSTNYAVKVEKDNGLVRGLKEYLNQLNRQVKW